MLEKLYKFRKIVFLLVFANYLLLSFYLVMNLALIGENTRNLENDSKSIKVLFIDENDTIYLENGTEVDGSSISSYIKINKGTGTWYVEDGSLLAVETVFTDLSEMLLGNVVCVVVLLIFVIRWYFRSGKFKLFRLFVLFTYVCFLLLGNFITWSYLGEVLGW